MAFRRKSSRRDFLKGKAAADALDEVARRGTVPASDHAASTPRANRSPIGAAHARGPSTYLFQIGRPAMATLFQVFLNAGQETHAPDAALTALDLVERLEDRLSIYRPHSEVSRINAQAGGEAMVVAPDLFDLLAFSVRLSELTGGAFDITSTPLSKLWGFHDRAGRFPTQGEIERVLARVGSHLLQLDAERRSVRLPLPEMELNLGSIGKGFALDRCAEQMEVDEVEHFLIHGGQSSVLARGNRLGVEGGGWSVAVGHPFREGTRLGELRLRDRALATSGSGNQFFHHQGRRYGHILDPRTGYPVEGALATTVVAPTATEADALATAFHVLGREAAEKWCADRPELGVILATPTSRAGGITVEVIGLAESDWRPAENVRG